MGGGVDPGQEMQAGYCSSMCDDYFKTLMTLVDRVLEEFRDQDVVRIKMVHNGQCSTDGRTDRQTDRQTDTPTCRLTDQPTYLRNGQKH